jgi:hypothetical protein
MPLTLDCTLQSMVKRLMPFVFFFLINFFLIEIVNVNFFPFSYQTFMTRIPDLTG